MSPTGLPSSSGDGPSTPLMASARSDEALRERGLAGLTEIERTHKVELEPSGKITIVRKERG